MTCAPVRALGWIHLGVEIGMVPLCLTAQFERRTEAVVVCSLQQKDRRGGSHHGLSQSPLRSEEHTSELQSRVDLVCRLLLEKKKIYMVQSSSFNPNITRRVEHN